MTTAGILARPTGTEALQRAMWAALATLLLLSGLPALTGVVDQVLAPSGTSSAPAPTPAVDEDAVRSAFDHLPMGWMAASGAADPSVRFTAQGPGYGAYLTPAAAVVVAGGRSLQLQFEGASTPTAMRAEAPLPGTFTELVGNDPSAWREGVATSEVVRYEQLWPGIDATVRGTGQILEWDLHVAPGVDPTIARVSLAGASAVDVDGDRASVTVDGRPVELGIPAVWQVAADGLRLEREARWRTDGSTLWVEPSGWDPALAGVVDPTVEWATYVGGYGRFETEQDMAFDIAVASDGDLIVLGRTYGPSFPSPRPGGNGFDAYVAEVSPDGTRIKTATRFGGNNTDDPRALTLKGGSIPVITGLSASDDLPTHTGAYQPDPTGHDYDVFVAILDPFNPRATFLGGEDSDSAYDIALDTAGNVYVVGDTRDGGLDFPITPGAYRNSVAGLDDVFVAKLDAPLDTLVYSTFVGGNSSETARAIAVDGAGNAFIGGFTNSTNYPTTAGTFDTTVSPSGDAFITKLNATGTGLVFSTLIGGDSLDSIRSLAIDGAGAVHAGGSTASSDFPTTTGAYDRSRSGDDDAFVLKLAPTGASLAYSTLLGGTVRESVVDLELDGSGRAHVLGYTESFATFPATVPRLGPGGRWDTFATTLSADGTGVVASTVIGGADHDEPMALALDGSGATYVAGWSYPGAVTTPGAMRQRSLPEGPEPEPDSTVMKLGPTGALVWSTYLSMPVNETITDVAIDATGIYVVGTTGSTFLPTTPGAVDATPAGDVEVFAAKLNPAGTAFEYLTFLGSAGEDLATGLAVGPDGSAYLTGTTRMSIGGSIFPPVANTPVTGDSWPTTVGAYDQSINGLADGFVTKLNPTGTTLTYSTYLGGAGSDLPKAIAVAANGVAHVVGFTDSSGFPTVNPLDASYNGGGDAFVTSVAANGQALAASTFLGSTAADSASDVALASTGQLYLVGSTDGSTFPTTASVLDTTHNGGTDGFVTVLNLDTSVPTIWRSTFLGGSSTDRLEALALGAPEVFGGHPTVYVTGTTRSANIPRTSGAVGVAPDGTFGDLVVAKLASGLNSLGYLGTKKTPDAAFFGATEEVGIDVAVDEAGRAHVIGSRSIYDGPFFLFSSPLRLVLNPTGTAFAIDDDFGLTGAVVPRSVALGPGGRVVLGGATARSDLASPAAAGIGQTGGGTAGYLVVEDVAAEVGAVPSDLTGDGLSDVSVYRPSSGRWYHQGSASSVAWGANGDIPVPGQYDADLETDRAVYRPSNGRWYVEGAASSVAFGANGDIPVPGQWDADPQTDFAVFRPSTGQWFVHGAPSAISFGSNGDVPVIGQWDGDPMVDIAVFRPANSTWYFREGPRPSLQFGNAGDIPVAGPWDRDPLTDVAVFRPGNGRWYVEGVAQPVSFGANGDVPVPGQWDADPEWDVAVFRRAAGKWFIEGGAAVAFGNPTDLPLVTTPAIRKAFFS